MFIDITRQGGRPLRLAVAAIAYMDATPDGCVLHLAGGQGLSVEQSPTEIEARIAQLTVCPLQEPSVDAAPTEPAPILLLEHKPAPVEDHASRPPESGSSTERSPVPVSPPAAASPPMQAAKPTRHQKRGRR